MKWLRISRKSGSYTANESGAMLVETLVALALVGTVVISFLSGLATASKVTVVTDEHSTAESLARTQMEYVKKATYVPDATTYAAAPIPDDISYTAYTVEITAAALNDPDDGIQKITLTIKRGGNAVTILECYKVNR